MRTCKICNVQKQYLYLALDERSRSVYKDEQGKIWHGRTCYDCFKKQIKSHQKPLGDINCIKCSTVFKQKTIRQKYCSKDCKNSGKQIF